MAMNFKRLCISIETVDYKSITSLWFRTIAICVDTLGYFIHGSFANGESSKMTRAFYRTQVMLLNSNILRAFDVIDKAIRVSLPVLVGLRRDAEVEHESLA
jgi:hypothetical protein